MSEAKPHPASLDPKALAAECSSTFTRRSGPGGQNRNKVETAVVLVHRPTAIGAEAAERRSQGENLKAAYFRLRLNLALQIRRPVAEGEAPSALWRGRCRGGKIVVSPTHEDYPALLAEALDRLAAVDVDLKAAAVQLGCTSSQLTRFLKGEPRAMIHLNRARADRGLHPIV